MDSQAGRKREGAWSQESPRSRVSAREPASQHAALAQFRGTEKGRRQPHRAAASKSPKGGERQNRGPSSTRKGERAGRRHRDRETGPALCSSRPPRSPTVPVTPRLSPGSAQGPAAAQPSTAWVTAGPSPLRPQGPWKSLCPSSSFRCGSLRGIPASYITGV